MDYETSPTMRYDGTGEAPQEADNQSEKNGSTGSEGSIEGFVKVEDVLDDGEDQSKAPPKETPVVEVKPQPEEPEATPSEMPMMKCLDPRESDDLASNQRLQDYYDQLPTETAPFVPDDTHLLATEDTDLHSGNFGSYPDAALPDVVDVPSAISLVQGHPEPLLVDFSAPPASGATEFVEEVETKKEDNYEEEKELGPMEELKEEEDINTPEQTEPEVSAESLEPTEPPKSETPPPVVEEVEKPPVSEPEQPLSKPFDVSSLLSCSVGGEADENVSAGQSEDPVVDLLYWKDCKASAVTFGLSLLVLLSLGCCSIVSVFSYLGLSLLTVTVSFRFYKFVIQTLNGTQQPNPFQSLLDAEVTLSSEQVHKYTDAVLSKLNSFIVSTRDLLLVKNVVASLKFGVFLWLMTYIGACFNGLTLLIMADVLAFVLPPVYQKYQKPIDSYCGQACRKMCELTNLARSYIPGAKPKAE